MNATLLLGAFFGLTATIAGALANHWVDPQYMGKVISAVRLHQIHSLAIIAIGLGLYGNLPGRLARMLKISAGLFGIGIVLFSGGIYLHYFLGFSGLSSLVPVGGTVVMVGWLALMWAALRGRA